jgi:hypothetical protein
VSSPTQLKMPCCPLTGLHNSTLLLSQKSGRFRTNYDNPASLVSTPTWPQQRTSSSLSTASHRARCDWRRQHRVIGGSVSAAVSANPLNVATATPIHLGWSHLGAISWPLLLGCYPRHVRLFHLIQPSHPRHHPCCCTFRLLQGSPWSPSPPELL